MLRTIWEWLWPPTEMEHEWSKWEIVPGAKMSLMPFGPSYGMQQRRCVECGVTEHASTMQGEIAQCGLTHEEDVDGSREAQIT